MNIPNLPTDNLYKFIAIFGLIVFVFSHYIINDNFKTSARMNMELDSKIDILEKELDSINKIESDISIFTNIREIMNGNDIENDSLKQITIDISEQAIEDKAKIMLSRVNRNNQLLDEIERTQKLIKINTLSRFDFNFFNVVSVVSIFVIFYGFHRWYWKHQYYIDLETKYKGETFLELVKEAEVIKKQKEKESKVEDNEPEV